MAEKFEQWCILEIMGHNKFAGLVSEQAIGGASFVRIDVPESEGLAAFSKLFGAASIYCITPITEEIARAMQQSLRSQPLSVYDIPEAIKAKLRPPLIEVDTYELSGDQDIDDDLDDGYDP